MINKILKKMDGEVIMRIDKFLKNSRIIKRRPVAKEACEQGRVKINGRLAKPGDILKLGDEVEIEFGTGAMKFRVLRLEEHVAKKDAESLYEIL